ncbi:hypothetical protein [Nannocystis sp.]|uniref:hypothetical protein n=1 Tax=Nannocystis sp. TaxID=1962667 RepID=UPI002426C68B|nr:hypothetical protein [Nannocystis sp.]MBK7826811.1 hypothetical protein [Nannocystis sp.]MBK9754431.1 hypothetical protein [Nannocystis sp.]
MSAAPRPWSLALSFLVIGACGRGELAVTESGSSSGGSTDDVTTTGAPTTMPPTTTVTPTTSLTSGDPTSESDTSTSSSSGDTSTGTTGTVETGGSSSGGASSSGSSGGDTGGNSCCVASDAPGCDDVKAEACVCAAAPECCADAWSLGCVAKVDLLGCGDCGGPPPKGECCEVGVVPGCSDPAIEVCVCEQMPECCSDVWTAECAAGIEGLMCGSCGPGPEACCEVQQTPGCPSPQIEDCVCVVDAFCCESAWDDICVGEVDSLGCAMCPVPVGPCCEGSGGLGCEDPGITACVCAAMPSCCDSEWTAECAAMVEPLGCAMCPSNCCVAHGDPGCEEPAVNDCVCAQDSFCCTDFWDDICVSEVEGLGCGSCA